MSFKTLRKRIALVATVSLGFGLLSVVPANAAVSGISFAVVTDPAGTYVTAVTSGSTTTVMTRNATVALADLNVIIATNSTDGLLTLAAGSSTATVTSYRVSGAVVAASTGTIASKLGTNTGSFGTTLAAGTTYRVWDDANSDADWDAATEESRDLVIVQTTATAVTATLDNSSTTIAGRANQQVSITATGDLTAFAASTSTYPVMRVAAAITQQPATSMVYPTISVGSGLDTDLRFADTSITVGSTAIALTTGAAGTSSAVSTINYGGNGNVDVTGTDANLGVVTFTPTVAGTYSLTVWNESSTSGEASLSGSESYKVFTINVSAGVTTVALTAINSTAVKSGANGSLIKVSLKDAAGNAAILAPGETVTLTPSGSGDIATVNGTTVSSDAGASYNLSSGNFNSGGIAWINLVDTVAETSTLTASVNGGVSTSKSIVFKASVNVSDAPTVDPDASDWAAATDPDVSVPIGTSSLTWTAVASTGSTVGFTVTEATSNAGLGNITGYTVALSYDEAAAGSTTLGFAAITITATSDGNGDNLYEVATSSNAGAAVAGTEAMATAATNAADALSVKPANVNAVVGSTNTITATLTDLFGNAYANQTVTVTVAGKNPTTTAVTKVTDANGKVTFALTDANTNTAVNDVVTFAVADITSKTSTITYGTNAVSTLTLTYPGKTDLVAGTTTTDIDAGAAGADGSAAAVSVVAKNAAGALLAGVPVTFSVTGLTGAEVLTSVVTVYTDTTGTAATSVASYAAGKATVTATAGAITASGDIYFAQATATEARTITAAVNGSVVTATVKDRYGNVVVGARVWATRTGTAYFGSGASTSNGATDANGTIDFIIGGGTGTVKVQLGSSTAASATYGQSADTAGYVGGNATTGTEIDAYVAGDANDDQTGLGGSFTAAGVNSATVSVDVANAAADAASAAGDAAAEATDAANAATDAANSAAEAADAATAAAQDAADAVAALSAQVATLVANIKSQITALTTLVIKIQKKVKA